MCDLDSNELALVQLYDLYGVFRFIFFNYKEFYDGKLTYAFEYLYLHLTKN